MDTLTMESRPPVQKAEHTRYFLVWFAYVCYVTVVLMPVGAVISVYEWWRNRNIRLNAYEPNLLATAHYRWLGRTFMIGTIAMMVAAGHFYYGVGIVTAIVTIIWFVYRLVMGMTLLAKHEPPPLAELTMPSNVTSVKYTYD